jgi:histidine kinase
LTMMGQAIAGMAHGIKNVLTGLDGGIYMVDYGLNNNNTDEMLKGWEIIKRNVNRITNGVKDILYSTRTRDHELSMIDPGEAAGDVYSLFLKASALENINLESEIDEGLGSIPLNSEGLHTILSNLVHNAIEACKSDESGRRHTITIRAFRKGPLVIFEVADDGPGIPKEWEKSLFTRPLSSKDRYGSGLGLLITKKIVDELCGQITFISAANAGTTFRVTFPAKRSKTVKIK